VVVPAFEAEASIGAVVRGLTTALGPDAGAVLVVDDGSRDGTAAAADISDGDRAGFRRAVARYGFMETPDIPRLLDRPELKDYSLDYVTFFLGRETVLPTGRPGMMLWRERLFAFLTRNAQPATAFFGIPPSRVMEIGSQIEI
jgi:K+ transporter